MEIEGLVAEPFTQTGLKGVRLYPEGKSRQRFIRVGHDVGGGVLLQLIEGREPPGLDPGETLTLAREDDALVDRLVRAMARLHFDLEEVETGHTKVDTDLLSRGFEIRFLRNGAPSWTKSENGLNYEITKPGSTGLPAHFNSEIQAKIVAPFNATVVVVAPNFESLMAFVDMREFLGQMQPNTLSNFTLVEDAAH
jgi:hypothetical protein